MMLNIKKMIPWLVFPWVIAVSMPCSGEVGSVVSTASTSAVVGQVHLNASAVSEISLQDQKLQEEVKELKLKNEQLESFWAKYGLSLSIFLSILGVLGGLFKFLIAYRNSITAKKTADKRQESENLRRAGERFSIAVAQIATNASRATNMLGATSLLTFLNKEYEHLHEQVFRVLLTTLRVNDLPMPVKKILVKGMEKAIQDIFKPNSEIGAISSDWTGAYLKRINLKSVNFRRVDFAFSNMRQAQMSSCIFQEAKFHGANLRDANFSKANLVSAQLNNADLRNAKFSDAYLQDALFGKALLRGTLFYGANLKEAKFCDCNVESFGEKSLESILNAKNSTWKKAWFEKDVWEKLFELNDSKPERDTLTEEEKGECLNRTCKKGV
ncbi:MAG: pentapeptide repeat-containing protein [Gallionella sp.]|nr:pentapeptide repeat-containing protein [Gallionella sp.]